jgi:hypothetical protein
MSLYQLASERVALQVPMTMLLMSLQSAPKFHRNGERMWRSERLRGSTCPKTTLSLHEEAL